MTCHAIVSHAASRRVVSCEASGYVRRAVRTTRFVARTYTTLHRMRAGHTTPQQAGEALAKDCATMGPLYIKLAQFISARRDLADPDFIEALSVVQDSLPATSAVAPAVPGVAVEPTPVASASIADVFRGVRAKDGRRVAIKQRRPGVKEHIVGDLPLLLGVMLLAAALQLPGARNMYEMIRESESMLLGELDFRREASSARQFSRLFRDVDWVRVPRVLRSSEDVMVSEWLPSRKLAEVAAPNEELAERLMDLYMMMLGQGVVRADPHPGNIGVLPGGKVVLYDFGAVLEVGGDVKEQVARLLQAGLTQNVDGVLSGLEDMGVLAIRPGQRTAVRHVLRRAMAGNVHEELQSSPEFTGNSEERAVRISSTFIYLARTLTLIEGACRQLDPDFAYDYSQWVDMDAADGVFGLLRDTAALPSTVLTMQSDMEELQMRIMAELDAAKRTTAQVATAAAVVTAVALALALA